MKSDEEVVAELSNRDPEPEPGASHVPAEPRCQCGRVLDPAGVCPYLLSALRHHSHPPITYTNPD